MHSIAVFFQNVAPFKHFHCLPCDCCRLRFRNEVSSLKKLFQFHLCQGILQFVSPCLFIFVLLLFFSMNCLCESITLSNQFRNVEYLNWSTIPRRLNYEEEDEKKKTYQKTH